MVFDGSTDVTRQRCLSKIYIRARDRHVLVVLRAHHHLFVHCQPRRLPHHRAHVHAHQLRRRPLRAD
ncbi:hypothetical protein DPMN_060460 [Dreissena polymorpha]|uniref:Uncharacterized protein n=1 Tax=Dreissena polymorpha TaxID=45954 RepID=A0A9D4HFX8_DREPO|nr:hypothetical protein DPMN_060460 [Dreissena polymorpha]